jgi:hypothetical protein
MALIPVLGKLTHLNAGTIEKVCGGGGGWVGVDGQTQILCSTLVQTFDLET